MPAPPPPIVVIAETLEEICANWLAGCTCVVWANAEKKEDLRSHLAFAQGLIVRTYTQVNQELLEYAPNLRVVGRAGVGLDNIDLQACQQRGVQVVYTPDANTQAVVEYVLGLMLDELRPRFAMEGLVSSASFHDLRRRHVGIQLEGLTLGILGFGRIGKRLGVVADAIGMKLLANDLLSASTLRQTVDYPIELVDKPQLFRDCDILSIHVDGRSSNHHLIDAAALAQLKPSCLLINTSRGMVVDPAALACWARGMADDRGRAVLDVHDPEPPGEKYPLYDLSNVRLLPHLASRTRQAMLNMSWVVRDVVAVLEGRAPVHSAY